MNIQLIDQGTVIYAPELNYFCRRGCYLPHIAIQKYSRSYPGAKNKAIERYKAAMMKTTKAQKIAEQTISEYLLKTEVDWLKP